MKLDGIRIARDVVRSGLSRVTDIAAAIKATDEPVGADDGYFPEGSMIRRVQSEHTVGLLYGSRAMTIGVMDPRNFTGTAMHTFDRKRFFVRMAHTGTVFETIFFGTKAEADFALARVHRLHENVHGALPQDVGRWKAGTPYAAFGHEEMVWTVAVIFESALTIYELLVAKLSDAEREQLWADYRRWGELFGMPGDAAPATYPDFVEYWNQRMTSGDLCLSEEAKVMGYNLSFGAPLPLLLFPAKSMIELILKGSLPDWIRDAYGVSYNIADAAQFEALTRGIRGSRLERPTSVSRTLSKAYGTPWRGDNAAFFDLVARTERNRVKRGRTSMPGFSDVE
ncbi:oxygenase MpaB family protein [Smaragdicoccus niigatensis]|uniref:oxygenase MpaB family protein n=1 Tax=Smaragdicoccus niigatensis TaxID=359359 RepID=UPI000375FD19|nr:oxygenase MpaB family protein [Smaragdicoccus niigatensis]